MPTKLLAAALAVFLMLGLACAQEPKNVSAMLIDSKIAAANSHYKTVLTQIADKRTRAELAKTRGELKQIEEDLAILEEDRKTTEKEIADLVKEYNAAVKKRR
ncbi:hypothetical protein BH09VER1_BH09VER1_45950 [soil metagenome]